jgi:hypothetical protein
MSAEEIKSDTLNILLCNQLNKHLTAKQRAMKIAKCCKAVRDRTKDNILYNACRSVIKATSSGAYDDVIKSIALTESNYFYEYR